MEIEHTLLKLEKQGYIDRKPKAAYVFLLGFAYLLVWYFTFNFYLKYNQEAMGFWIIVLTIFTFFTFFYALFHLYVLKKIGKKDKWPKNLDEEDLKD